MKVDILGRPWSVVVLDSDKFVKRFKSEYAGITLPNSREIVINSDDFNIGTMIHELTHAYLGSLCTGAASLTNDQLEEVYCEFMAIHGVNVLELAHKLTKALKNQ